MSVAVNVTPAFGGVVLFSLALGPAIVLLRQWSHPIQRTSLTATKELR